MKYFFTYQDDLPADVGFTYFSLSHVLWLVIVVVLTVGFAIIYHKVNAKKQNTQSKVIGCALAAAYILRELVIACTGHMSVYELPLHLCIIAGFLCLIHAYTGNKLIGHFLYSGAIPCTLSALLTPDWTVYPPFSFISITNFLFHGLILVYAVCQLSANRLNISLRSTWKVFVMVCLIAVPVYAFDLIFKVNYMFLMTPSPGSVLSFISDIFTDKFYLAGFALFNMVVLLLMDGSYTLACFFCRKLKKE